MHELEKVRQAIGQVKQKILDQGRVTNARDEEHLENLLRLETQLIYDELTQDSQAEGMSETKGVNHV